MSTSGYIRMNKGRMLPHKTFDSTFFDKGNLYNSSTSSCVSRFHFEKPIVRSPRPQDFNKWLNQYFTRTKCKPVDFQSISSGPELVDNLATSRKWATTTAIATRSSIEPHPSNTSSTRTTQRIPAVMESTQESTTDPVTARHRASKYIDAPMLWQERGRVWDTAQVRSQGVGPTVDTPTQHQTRTVQAGNYPRNNRCNTGKTPPTLTNELKFWKPIPAYQGHIPRHPIPLHNEHEADQDTMCSTTRSSYRRPSPYDRGQLPHYLRNGRLSKTIVLTSPHNPFNKIDKMI